MFQTDRALFVLELCHANRHCHAAVCCNLLLFGSCRFASNMLLSRVVSVRVCPQSMGSCLFLGAVHLVQFGSCRVVFVFSWFCSCRFASCLQAVVLAIRVLPCQCVCQPIRVSCGGRVGRWRCLMKTLLGALSGICCGQSGGTISAFNRVLIRVVCEAVLAWLVARALWLCNSCRFRVLTVRVYPCLWGGGGQFLPIVSDLAVWWWGSSPFASRWRRLVRVGSCRSISALAGSVHFVPCGLPSCSGHVCLRVALAKCVFRWIVPRYA